MDPIGSHKSARKEGNTTSSRRGMFKYWIFVWNNYSEENIETLLISLKNDCENYQFQEEVGANGTHHLQGFIQLKKRKRMIENKDYSDKIHWEKCEGSERQNRIYTQKEGNCGRCWSTFPKLRLPIIITIEEMSTWQLELIAKIQEEPNDRTVMWYWSTLGATGKTSIAKYIYKNYDCCYVCGSSKDIKQGIAAYIDKSKKEPYIVIWDVPRTCQEYISYQAIEEIKNGLFFCPKYETNTIFMASPHILILSNYRPDKNKLSPDRWDIIEICKEKVVEGPSALC